MKIISKHKDYYDSVQIYGVDPGTVYIRKKQGFKNNKIDPVLKLFWLDDLEKRLSLNFLKSGSNSLFFDNLFLIFFCGKIYPCFILKRIKRKKKINESKLYLCYDIESINDLIKTYGSKNFNNRWFKNKKHWLSYFSYIENTTIENLFKMFSEVSKKQILDIHYKFGVPYFLISFKNSSLILNPVLKKYKFYKIFDTYKAYQEISMFISGILGGKSPPLIEISDKIRKEKHGFNKWSFRKEPKTRR